MFKRPAALNSIAMRLSAMFALVALLVFVLIGGALYQQVDKSIGRLPEAELDARYSVLESSINRYGNAEHWAKMSAKLDGPFEHKLLHTIRGMGYVLELRPSP